MQNVQFLCSSRNGQALLSMPDIEILNILSISCNTIGIEEADKDACCSTNTSITNTAGSGQYYTNTETGEPVRSCTNINSKSYCNTSRQ